VTSVKVKGKWYPIGVAVDAVSGLVVCVEGLKGEDAPSLKEWLQPVAETVGAELLVTDDADAFKQVADDLGLFHQICKSHVQRNTEQLVEELQSLAKEDRDGSLRAIGVTAAQAVADLERLKELVQERQPEQGEGVRNDAGAVSEGLAASGGGEGECCVSDSVTVAGSLEFVGSVDAVSEVEGAKG